MPFSQEDELNESFARRVKMVTKATPPACICYFAWGCFNILVECPAGRMRRDRSPALCGGMTEDELGRSKASDAGCDSALRTGFRSSRDGTLERALCCFDVEHKGLRGRRLEMGGAHLRTGSTGFSRSKDVAVFTTYTQLDGGGR